MSMMRRKMIVLLSALGLSAGGCVQRTLTINSTPPGALVYLNDQEVGRTPVTRHFLWYGTYDVELRMPGYTSIKTKAPVIAPWWQWVPLDFFDEVLPVTDHHDFQFAMHPPTPEEQDPARILARGQQLQTELHSTQRPTTSPTTRPHHSAKPPTTSPAR